MDYQNRCISYQKYPFFPIIMRHIYMYFHKTLHLTKKRQTYGCSDADIVNKLNQICLNKIQKIKYFLQCFHLTVNLGCWDTLLAEIRS